ncbi:unnamed protein product [Musa acuminata subsp. burmannicoides]
MLTLLYFGCLFDVEPQSGLRRRRWSKPKMPSFEPGISTRTNLTQQALLQILTNRSSKNHK